VKTAPCSRRRSPHGRRRPPDARLADTGRSEQQDGLAVDDEPAPGDLAHLCPVDRWLRAKVEACQVAREQIQGGPICP
jgi:hypothetical protein